MEVSKNTGLSKGKLIGIIDKLIAQPIQPGSLVTIGNISLDDWIKLRAKKARAIGYFFPCADEVADAVNQWYRYYLVPGEYHRPNSPGILLMMEWFS